MPQIYRNISSIKGGRLYRPGRENDPIVVGTTAWFEWLEQHRAFTFDDAPGAFTAYKSGPPSIDSPWEASVTQEDRRSRVWLGPSRALTLERLQEAARTLAEPHSSGGPSQALQAEAAAAAGYLPPGARLSYPRLPADTISRPRLLARLDAGLSGPLTLVSAPAGSGKTTLLAQWLATLSLPAAWLSFAPADNELPRFVHALVSALQRAVPGACPASVHLRDAPRFPPLAEVLALLSGELADLPGDVVVVLDDAHLLTPGSEGHALLAALLAHPPAQLHLVLATRTPPPLPLARGQLVELGATELRLTREEMTAFLARLLGEPPSGEVNTALVERTEGWPALVRLAGLSLRESPDQATFLARLAQVSERTMRDYLLEEVLATLAPATREMLMRLSIFRHFNVELAAATLGGEVTTQQVQALLEEVEHTGLLVVPLDERQGWYRLHHLFQMVMEQRLQARISPDELVGLHQRASAWYAGRGLLDEALEEAMASGDGAATARLVEAQVVPAFKLEQWVQLEGWLQLVPEAEVQASPRLLFAQAWVLQARGQFEDYHRALSTAEQLLATSERGESERDNPQSRLLHALIALARANYQYFRGQVQASLESARSALQLLPPGELDLAALATHLLARPLQATGQEEEAFATLQQTLREHPARPNNLARLLFGLGSLYLAAGKLPQVEHTARHLLQLTQDGELVLSQNYAHWLLGVVSYEGNRLEEAVYHFSAVLANRHRAHLWFAQDAVCGLALAYHAQGLDAEARATRDDLLAWVQDQYNLPQLLVAYAFAARLSLLQEEVEEAGGWLDLAGEHVVAGPMWFFEDPPVTHARLLLARGDEASLGKAQSLLDELLRHLEATHNTRKTIAVLVLRAWACKLRGQRPEALTVLERALKLGQTGGFVRTFADLPELAPLLRELRRGRKEQRVVDKQRDAYLELVLAAMRPLAATAIATEELMRKEGLAPLTARELDILLLLERESTNKQIAQALGITPETVKVHTVKLYRKLGVDNRRAAVTLAKALGLLTREPAPSSRSR